MADSITKGDLLEVAGDLRDHIDARLDAVRADHGQQLRDINSHLSALNSKVATHEARFSEVGVKVANVEREVFQRPRRVPDAVTSDAKPAVTKGDLKRLVGGLTLLGLVLELLRNGGEFLFGLIKVHGK